MHACKLLPFAVGMCGLASTAHALAFTQGDFYATNCWENTIWHHRQGPGGVESMAFPPDLSTDLRGLVFGPDNLLYVVAQQSYGFAVFAMDEAGTIQQTYPFSSQSIVANGSFGKIAMGSHGQFFVGGPGGLVRFDRGFPNSGALVHAGATYDVEVLASGNLLSLQRHSLAEWTPDGTFVREVPQIGIQFSDNMCVEYDPATDRVYLAMIGYTGQFNQILMLNGTTGQVLSQETLQFAVDMHLDDAGRLIVGRSYDRPVIYDTDLNPLGYFAGSKRMFITQYIPEPASIWLLVAAAFITVRTRRIAC